MINDNPKDIYELLTTKPSETYMKALTERMAAGMKDKYGLKDMKRTAYKVQAMYPK